MSNITAFLLVLTLTGAPVAGVVCVTDCPDEPVTSNHCHADMATSDGPMIYAGDSCDDPSISNSPYVIEHRAVPGAAVLTATPFSTTPGLARTEAPASLARVPSAQLEPPFVLRI